MCGNNICEGNESRTCPDDCSPEPPTEPPAGFESCGCSSGLTSREARAGRTYVRELVVGSNPPTRYEVRLPSDYSPDRPGGYPLLVYLHGWGGNYRSLPSSFARHAKDNGYLVVTPTGYGDGGRNSWNGFRSARLPSCSVSDGYTETDCDANAPGGPSTCVDRDNSGLDYCYTSCQDQHGNCPKWDGIVGPDNTWGSEFSGDYTCYWTTCLDSVAQIEALLGEVESLYCVDRSMISVTGCSNGGMFVFELAKDPRTSERIATYLPQVGSPHPGFIQENPTLLSPPLFFMGFWGVGDNTVPGTANFPELFGPDVALDTNFNGWLYMTARSITEQWATMTGAAGPMSYDASAYSSSLNCHAWESGSGEEAEIIECFFQGGHSCPGFGNMPQMMWNFAERHPRTVVPPSADCSP